MTKNLLMSLRVYVFIVLSFYSLILLNLYTFCIRIVCIPFPRLYRPLADCNAFGQSFISFLVKYVTRVKFTVSGVDLPTNQSSLIIMNHQSCFDWMFLWEFYPLKAYLTYKQVQKRPVSRMPIIGPLVKSMGSLFLDRQWSQDKKTIDEMMDYYRRLDYPLTLVLFPEGTSPSAKNIERSIEHAQKQGLQPMKYLMCPRTTGFSYIFERLRKDFHFEYIYDVTIAFDGPIPLHEDSVLRGVMPQRVHCHVERHACASVEQSGPETWLLDIWKQKDERLNKFYWGRMFNDSPQVPQKAIPLLLAVLIVASLFSVYYCLAHIPILSSGVTISALLWINCITSKY